MVSGSRSGSIADVYCLIEARKEKQSESWKLLPSKWNEVSFFYPSFATQPYFHYTTSSATLLVEASQICKLAAQHPLFAFSIDHTVS